MWPYWSKFSPGAWSLRFSETQVRSNILTSLFLLPADSRCRILGSFSRTMSAHSAIKIPLSIIIYFKNSSLRNLLIVLWSHSCFAHPSQLSPLPNLPKVIIFKKKNLQVQSIVLIYFSWLFDFAILYGQSANVLKKGNCFPFSQNQTNASSLYFVFWQ